jgi:hypothetical protein
MRSSFDPYACGDPVPTPGRLTVRKDGATGRHVFTLPAKPAGVVSRVVFMEVEGVGTRTVSASASAREVSYAFPPGVKVVAFLTYQDGRGERSRAGPLLHFWTTVPEDQG